MFLSGQVQKMLCEIFFDMFLCHLKLLWTFWRLKTEIVTCVLYSVIVLARGQNVIGFFGTEQNGACTSQIEQCCTCLFHTRLGRHMRGRAHCRLKGYTEVP